MLQAAQTVAAHHHQSPLYMPHMNPVHHAIHPHLWTVPALPPPPPPSTMSGVMPQPGNLLEHVRSHTMSSTNVATAITTASTSGIYDNQQQREYPRHNSSLQQHQQILLPPPPSSSASPSSSLSLSSQQQHDLRENVDF